MISRLSLILVLALSTFSLCARPQLRSDVIFRPSQLINILADQLTFIIPRQKFDYPESDSLNEFAQELAEHNGNPIEFINSYTKSSEHLLTFGFRLRGNTTLETILLGDSTQASENTSGFLDFRYKQAKLSLQADEIRDSILVGRCFTPGNYELNKCNKFKSSGVVSIAGETFNFNKKLNGLRDLLSVMNVYHDFIDSQIKLMDKDGNIPIGFKPATLKMDFTNFNLHLETLKNHVIPLRVNPNADREDLFYAITHHFKQFVDNAILEAFQLPEVIDKYGFGISVDSNDVITVVYTFGGKNRPTSSQKSLEDYHKWSYVTPKGNTVNFNAYVRESNYVTQRRTNRLIIDTINLDRLSSNLRPLRELTPKLYELTQKEADRAAQAGKLIAPAFSGVTKNTILFATHIVGKTTIREFVFPSEKSVGTIACFDNFTNSKARVYGLFEQYGNICNKQVVANWKQFDSVGTNVGWNANGDFFSYAALQASEN